MTTLSQVITHLNDALSYCKSHVPATPLDPSIAETAKQAYTDAHAATVSAVSALDQNSSMSSSLQALVQSHYTYLVVTGDLSLPSPTYQDVFDLPLYSGIVNTPTSDFFSGGTISTPEQALTFASFTTRATQVLSNLSSNVSSLRSAFESPVQSFAFQCMFLETPPSPSGTSLTHTQLYNHIYLTCHAQDIIRQYSLSVWDKD